MSSSGTATDFIPQVFDPATTRSVLNPSEAAEQARVLAFDKGYNDGLNKAHADVEAATEESNKRVRRTIASLREAIDMFDQREATALTTVENAIVTAAFEIAKAVVQRELAVTVDPGAEAIARALQLVPARTDVVARLHPEDAATLNVESVPTGSRTLLIVPDATIEPGGCIVEADDSTIDTQFTAVFANVRSALGLSPASEAEGIGSKNSRTTASEAPLS